MQLAKLGLGLALGWMMVGAAVARDVPTTQAVPQVTLTPQGEYRQRLKDAAKLFESGDFAAANKAYKPLVPDKRLDELDGKQQMTALLFAAAAAFHDDDPGRSRDLFGRSMRLAQTPYAAYMLSILEAIDGKSDLAAHYLAIGVREDPAQLSDYHDMLVPEVLRGTTKGSPEKLELMQALFDTDWDRQGLGASNVWFTLAETRLAQGESDQAKSVIARIDGSMSVARLRVDRRFDAIVAALPDLPTPEAAARARVDTLRQLVKAQPKHLEALTSLVGALQVVGDWDEAIRLIDEATARIKAAPADEPAYEDMRQVSWLKDRRSRSLLALGRVDEALEELKSAAAIRELDQPNVSQVLNLGVLYCQLGRPDEALAAIKGVGENISDYGRMVEASVRACAAVLKRDARGTQRALAYLREHRADGDLVYMDALLTAGLQDDAARELIRNLEDPLLRADSLMFVQGFREPDAMPGEVENRRIRDQVLARADVQAAIQKVGRRETFAIYAGWDDE